MDIQLSHHCAGDRQDCRDLICGYHIDHGTGFRSSDWRHYHIILWRLCELEGLTGVTACWMGLLRMCSAITPCVYDVILLCMPLDHAVLWWFRDTSAHRVAAQCRALQASRCCQLLVTVLIQRIRLYASPIHLRIDVVDHRFLERDVQEPFVTSSYDVHLLHDRPLIIPVHLRISEEVSFNKLNFLKSILKPNQQIAHLIIK